MTPEEDQLHQQRRERVARVKRLLRWMPRKATMHRYPVLKWFRAAAIKRSYIWSFRVKAVIPAIYVGCILAFLPLYGVQIPLAVLAAFALRANLPILASAQFITNPLTVLPVYYTAYQIGRLSLNLLSVETPHLNMSEMRHLLGISDPATVMERFQYLSKVWLVTSLGGAMLGLFSAAVVATVYKVGAYEVAASYQRLRELQHRRLERQQAQLDAPEPLARRSVHERH